MSNERERKHCYDRLITYEKGEQMKSVIYTKGLTKYYGDAEIVSNVNLHLKKGEIYGLLGENGAGKSTIMKMLVNLVKPTDGYVELFGEKLEKNSLELMKRIGMIIEEPIFYRNLTVMENKKLHCEYMGYYNWKDIDRALEMLNLSGAMNKKITQLSLGMKQRLAIARAIVTKPELLILDEPINGLDPTGIKEVRNLFRELNEKDGVTILISSHILSEVEQVASTIGVISQHHLTKEISMTDIHAKEGKYLEVKVDNVQNACVVFDSILGLKQYKIMNEEMIRIYEEVNQNEIMTALINRGIEIKGISRKELSLEDYFFESIKEN